MSDYPIEGLMNTAMNSIKEMVDVNTIIGEPIETSNNVVVIPVSKVNFGFAAGGSEFKGKVEKNNIIIKSEKDDKNEKNNVRMPFGGGSGAGVSISPIAFIIIQETGVKLLPVEHNSSLDKLLDLIPDLFDKTNQVIDKQINKVNKINKSVSYKIEQDSKEQKNGNNDNNDNNTIKYDVEYDETTDI